MCKKWLYNELGASTPATITEEEIIAIYYNGMKKCILERFGKERAENFTEQDCIDEFVVVHWAWEEMK